MARSTLTAFSTIIPIQRLLSPSLIFLYIAVGDSEDGSLQSFLANCPFLCPNLQFIFIHTASTEASRATIQTLSRVVTHYAHLEYFPQVSIFLTLVLADLFGLTGSQVNPPIPASLACTCRRLIVPEPVADQSLMIVAFESDTRPSSNCFVTRRVHGYTLISKRKRYDAGPDDSVCEPALTVQTLTPSSRSPMKCNSRGLPEPARMENIADDPAKVFPRYKENERVLAP